MDRNLRSDTLRQAGFTMTEFMVGIALSGLAMGLLVSVQIRIQSAMKQQGDTAKSLKSSTTALSLIAQAVRSAGEGFPLVNPAGAVDVWGTTPNTGTGTLYTQRIDAPGMPSTAPFPFFVHFKNNGSQGIISPIEVDNEGATNVMGDPDIINTYRGVGPLYQGTAINAFSPISLRRPADEITGPTFMILRQPSVSSAAPPDAGIGCVAVIEPGGNSMTLQFSSSLTLPTTPPMTFWNACTITAGAVTLQKLEAKRFYIDTGAPDATETDCIRAGTHLAKQGYLIQEELTAGGIEKSVLGRDYSNLQIAQRVRTYTSDPDGTGANMDLTDLSWFSGRNQEVGLDFTSNPPAETFVGPRRRYANDPGDSVSARPYPIFDYHSVEAVAIALESRSFRRTPSSAAMGCQDVAAMPEVLTTQTAALGSCSDVAHNDFGDAAQGTASTCFGTQVTSAHGAYFPEATYSAQRLVVSVANTPPLSSTEYRTGQ